MLIARRDLLFGAAASGLFLALPAGSANDLITAPGEFEAQDFIWLSWRDQGFLGSRPFTDVAIEMMRALTPHVKVRLLFSDEVPPYSFGKYNAERLSRPDAEAGIRSRLTASGIDLSRVELFYFSKTFGAIQDPGPFFLRRSDGGLAIADYRYDHPDPRSAAMDSTIAAELGLPTIASPLVSEGGGRQSNGRGVLLLVKAVELARNPGWALPDIEREHLRVHGARKVIWLEEGPAEESWGRLGDGRWGIGTGGHVDVFARFADEATILLTEVSIAQRDAHPILAQTWRRMERNAEILRAATDQDGRPFRIIRVPSPDPIIASYEVDAMTPEEHAWFEGAQPGQRVEYYQPGGYLNFVIANGVVLTAKLGVSGRGPAFNSSDEAAADVLRRAFPDRQIVQIDVTPLLHDGAGLHCHSRNQPT